MKALIYLQCYYYLTISFPTAFGGISHLLMIFCSLSD